MPIRLPNSTKEWTFEEFFIFKDRLAYAEGFSYADMEDVFGRRSWDEINSDLKPLYLIADSQIFMSLEDCVFVYGKLSEMIPVVFESYPNQRVYEFANAFLDALRNCIKERKNLEGLIDADTLMFAMSLPKDITFEIHDANEDLNT